MGDADAGVGSTRLFHVAACVLIASVCLLAYSNAFDAGFTYDDESNILQNPFLRWTQLDGDSLRRLLLSSANRRPVANLTFALNYYAGRYEVWGYHAVNVAIHGLCGLLVYGLGIVLYGRLARLPGQRGPGLPPGVRPWLALLAALLFVAHPLQTQAVTYVVQRMTSLAALFSLASLWLYARGRQAGPGGRRAAAFAGSGLCGLLALGSKENAVTLPFAVWGIEWFFFRDLDPRFARRSALRVLLPLLLLGLGAYAVAVWGPEWGYGRRSFTMGERLLTQLRVVVFYLSLIAFPHPERLSLLHEISTSRSLWEPPATLLCAGLLLALLGMGVAAVRAWRLVSFAIFWFFLHLLVESTVLPLEMVYEHRVYLPLAGIAWLLPWALWGLAPRRSAGRGAALALATALVAALALAAHARNRVWRSPETLWAHTVALYPASARARASLGVALVRRGRVGEAVVHYTEALRLDPGLAPAYRSLAGALLVSGRPEEAVALYREAVRRAPRDHLALGGLGHALLSLGRLDEAAEAYASSLEDWHEESVFRGLAHVRARQGRLDEAAHYYEWALRTNPESVETHAELAAVRAGQGRFEEASRSLERALKLARARGQAALAEQLRAQLGPYREARPSPDSRP